MLTGEFIYVPGFGGTVWKVNKSDGTAVSRINPFGTSIDKNKFVAGPLTADAQGDVYYNVIKLDPTNPWLGDVLGTWLVKVSADDTASTVTFKKLTKGAPKGTDNCPLFSARRRLFLGLRANTPSPSTYPAGRNGRAST